MDSILYPCSIYRQCPTSTHPHVCCCLQMLKRVLKCVVLPIVVASSTEDDSAILEMTGTQPRGALEVIKVVPKVSPGALRSNHCIFTVSMPTRVGRPR